MGPSPRVKDSMAIGLVEEGGEGEGTALPLVDVQIDTPEWNSLCPSRGQVIEVYMPGTERENAPDLWAAFLVMEATLTPKKEVVLEVKSLGSSSQELDKEHSLTFNRRVGKIHLCSGKPCLAGEGYAMHATRVRVFNLDGYEATWYTASTKRQVEKWLGDNGKEPPGRKDSKKTPEKPGKEDKSTRKSGKGPPGAKERKAPEKGLATMEYQQM